MKNTLPVLAAFAFLAGGADTWVRPYALAAGVGADPRVGPGQAPARVDPAKEKRLEWFREAKYGLFIHWGLYALPAGEWHGKRSPGLGEWGMLRSAVAVWDLHKIPARLHPAEVYAGASGQTTEEATV